MNVQRIFAATFLSLLIPSIRSFISTSTAAREKIIPNDSMILLLSSSSSTNSNGDDDDDVDIVIGSSLSDRLRVELRQESSRKDKKRRDLLIDLAGVGVIGASGVAAAKLFTSSIYTPAGFTRTPTQFIAALGDPDANAGTGAEKWGLWQKDPGPRGVRLNDFETLKENEYASPAGWKFDENDWWVEEHGIIMEAPQFPLAPGRYLVTGARSVTTGINVDADGNWKLDGNAKLYDVTHLPCRSARYRPLNANASPSNARSSDFPVKPGATMPNIDGYQKRDYAVLFLVGKATS